MSCENNKILMTSRNRLISRSHRANTLILVDTLESFLIDGARAELSRDSLTPRLISQKLNGIRSCFVFFVVRPFLSSHFQCAKEARKEAAAHVRVSLWEKSRPGLNESKLPSDDIIARLISGWKQTFFLDQIESIWGPRTANSQGIWHGGDDRTRACVNLVPINIR